MTAAILTSVNGIRIALAPSVALKASAGGDAATGQLPTRVKVLGWGRNATSEGVILVDDLTVKVFAANQKAIGREQVAIDFEHNTVPGTPEYLRTAEPRAIGGYTNLVCVTGEGIFGEAVTYTATGQKSAADFADLSLAPYLDKDNRVIGAHSVGLTRTGATYGITFSQAPATLSAEQAQLNAELKILSAGLLPVVATNDNNKNTNMDTMIKLAVLSAALGLAESADEASVTTELKKRLTVTAPEKIDTAALLAPLTARLDGIEAKLKEQAGQANAAEAVRLVALFAADGKLPVNHTTKKAYTVEELNKLDLPTLQVLHANTPATVPLSARKTPVDSKAVDPNLKGRARFIAAQDAVNATN